jgi:glycerate dehydrogenase
MNNLKINICILDAHTTNAGDLSWQGLENLGNLTIYERTMPEEVLPRAEGMDVLITNKVLITAEHIEKLPELKLVCLMSTGTNAVDLEACRERGIPVCNIPAYSTASVAEHTFSLLLAWAREPEAHSGAVRAGKWVSSPDFCFTVSPQRELAGRTLGLIGFGDIAQAVARIAVAFGMKVVSYTPHPKGKPELGQTFLSMDEVFATADIVSLHCPLTAQTQALINAQRIEGMKSGVVVINTGRGGLIHEQQLAEALASGKVGGALLDVLSTEPPAADNPLLTAPNCLITPHIAWATEAARVRLMQTLAENVNRFLDGEPQHVVNGI